MYTLVKGTNDVILNEAEKFSYIENMLYNLASLYNFKEFRTPILEYSELYLRSVGNSSDIVRKEMYSFYDKANRSVSLRPEITAGVIRSMVNNKLFFEQDFPVKAFYLGPCFRYERPQKGRSRQFTQFGVECVGVDNYFRDCEVIILAYICLKFLGFDTIKLKINTLGDRKSREDYKEALRKYFSLHVDKMCDDCKERYKLNVLRILDCKVEDDKKIVEDAPKIKEFLSDESKLYFKNILKTLDEYDIEYEVDDHLVRGLDYYSDVVFEFHYTSKKGVDYGAICAGGHYDELVLELGGPRIQGVGFAFGIERLVSIMNDDNLFDNVINSGIDLFVMPLGENAKNYSFYLCNLLRNNGFKTEICFESKKMNQMFKKAERREAKYALIIGDDEIKSKVYKLKNLNTKEQIDVEDSKLIETLDRLLSHGEDCCCEKCASNKCSCNDKKE